MLSVLRDKLLFPVSLQFTYQATYMHQRTNRNRQTEKKTSHWSLYRRVCLRDRIWQIIPHSDCMNCPEQRCDGRWWSDIASVPPPSKRWLTIAKFCQTMLSFALPFPRPQTLTMKWRHAIVFEEIETHEYGYINDGDSGGGDGGGGVDNEKKKLIKF